MEANQNLSGSAVETEKKERGDFTKYGTQYYFFSHSWESILAKTPTPIIRGNQYSIATEFFAHVESACDGINYGR